MNSICLCYSILIYFNKSVNFLQCSQLPFYDHYCIRVSEDKVWSTVVNNLPAQTAVTGSSRERRTVLQLNYSASMEQVTAITNSAEHCEQHVAYACRMSRLLNTPGTEWSSECVCVCVCRLALQPIDAYKDLWGDRRLSKTLNKKFNFIQLYWYFLPEQMRVKCLDNRVNWR